MATVVVVGAGLAGLVAALSAARSGAARVLLLEKERVAGGNSAKATSGINGCGSAAQTAAGVHDSVGAFLRDTVDSGQSFTDPTLARVLTTRSADALAFLASFGLALDGVTQCGGHSAARTHFERPGADGRPRPVGWDIVSALRTAAEATPGVALLKGCRVVELLQAAGGGYSTDVPRGATPVTGVRVLCADAAAAQAVAAAGATPAALLPASTPPGPPLLLELAAHAVVLATGGFAGDHTSTSLLMEFAPGIASLATTNGPFATGDGVKLGRLAGAHLRGMEFVQVHPTGFVDPADPVAKTKFLAPEALRGFGGIMLNSAGVRFVDELGRRDAVTHEMYRWCTAPSGAGDLAPSGPLPRPVAIPRPVVAFLVVTAGAVAKYGPNFAFYEKKGFFTRVEGAMGLAGAIGAGTSPEVVADTLRRYAAAAAAGRDPLTQKHTFPDAFSGAAEGGVMYVARVTPSIHYTMGGIATSAAAELMYVDMSEVVRGNLLIPDEMRVAPEPEATDWNTAQIAPQQPPLTTTVLGGSGGLTAAAPPLRQAADLEAAPDLGADLVPLDTYTGLYERPVLRPIPRLFGAGEVTGGLHGANRLAGNSLLECVVFGRIAGERAAATALSDAPALRSDAFTPLAFRESHRVCDTVFLFRFNLPSPLHGTGLAPGQYISVRAVVGGAEVVRFYSPVSRPEAPGHVDLLIKVDPHGGPMSQHMAALQPGDTLDFKGPLGGLILDLRPGHDLGRVKRIGLVAGGTGIAPMLQILRASWVYNARVPLTLLYSAATPEQLAYLPWLRRKSRMHPNFTMHCAVDTVPPGVEWKEHVGFIDEALIRAVLPPPEPDVLIVLCGPFPMCKALKGVFARLGYSIGSGPTDQVYSYM